VVNLFQGSNIFAQAWLTCSKVQTFLPKRGQLVPKLKNFAGVGQLVPSRNILAEFGSVVQSSKTF